MNSLRNKEAKDISKDAPAKSQRFVRGIPRSCSNPLCRSDFSPKRKDHRFCGRKCKKTFFTLKYAILTLAPYFNVELEQGPDGDG